MTQYDSSKTKPSAKPTDADDVDEASRESFLASDSPAATAITGEKGTAVSETNGCATSFIMQERGEIGGMCGEAQKGTKAKYIQPDKEKEAGGEG